MNLTKAQRVTILVDSVLRDLILDKIQERGARNFNYIECRGRGMHAITGTPFECDELVRIEILTTEEISCAILNDIHAAQFAQLSQYALSACVETVHVDDRDRSMTTE